jgi:hypothetical protein
MQNMGDTHIGKRKLKAGSRKDKGKKVKTMDEAVLGSDESTSSPDEGGSPPYQESNLSSSSSSDDDDGDGVEYRIEPSHPPIQFTGVKYRQIYFYFFHIIFQTSLTHALLFIGVTLHSCHSEHGPWCTTFSEGEHYGQRKGKGKTILSFPGGQFIFSKYR